jgi:formiminotetrahydrofolate cyclodeaminase
MANETMDEFLDSLAARTSTPGGGAVTAITGAQAAALISMVSRFTSQTDEMTQIIQRAEEARAKFLQLVKRDISAFENLMLAFKTKKETKGRTEIIQAALIEAADAPRAMMLQANSLIDDTSILSRDGNQNLITDTAMVAVLLKAAIESAEYNILINLKSIKNQGYIEEAHADIESCRQNMVHLGEIADSIRSSLAPKQC